MYQIYRKFNYELETNIVYSKDRLCYLVYCNSIESLYCHINSLYCRFDCFELVLAVEQGKADIDNLLSVYPKITIIEFLVKPTRAQIIDVASRIIVSNYFFFIDTLTMISNCDFSTLLSVLKSYKNPIVVAPVYITDDREFYPSIRAPQIMYMNIVCSQFYPYFRLQDTLYPLNFVGIYNKEKYNKAGGFDLTIKDDYYQLLEFSTRSWLSGYSIISVKSFVLHHAENDDLVEHIKVNKYMDAVNFRVRFLYKRVSDMLNVKLLHFLFKLVDNTYSEKFKQYKFFLMNFRTLIQRWSIEEVTEIL